MASSWRRLGPGEWRTCVVAWEPSDQSKAGDAHYWWTAEELRPMLQKAPPELAKNLYKAGTPKGEPLREVDLSFRDFASKWSDGEGGSRPPRAHIGAALAHWRDADPDETYLIVEPGRGPGPDSPSLAELIPPEVEELRQDWVAALERGDDDAPALREQLDEEFATLGIRKVADFDAFSPSRATEIIPGVWVQDDRPARR